MVRSQVGIIAAKVTSILKGRFVTVCFAHPLNILFRSSQRFIGCHFVELLPSDQWEGSSLMTNERAAPWCPFHSLIWLWSRLIHIKSVRPFSETGPFNQKCLKSTVYVCPTITFLICFLLSSSNVTPTLKFANKRAVQFDQWEGHSVSSVRGALCLE